MKVIILAGGYGTRISEESGTRPKPMVEIGGRPILWHIMKLYATHGYKDFVICCGYKGQMIKEYFLNYSRMNSDFSIDLKNNHVTEIRRCDEDWRVTLIDTGETTMTGGRLKRALDQIDGDDFFVTYGDGVCDIDVSDLTNFHRGQGLLATVTAVQPPGRFGSFTLGPQDTTVMHFREKPLGDGAWVNGGFFVVKRDISEYLRDDTTVWEQEPMMDLAHDGQLAAYRHLGFWHPMDTLRDMVTLQKMWDSGSAPWKTWQ